MATTERPRLGFRRFKVNDVDPTSLIFIIGKRGTGKTRLVCDLAYNWHMNGMKDGARIDMVVCFTPTESVKNDFRVFVPYALLYPRFSESVANDIVRKQKEYLKKYGHGQNILMIIDDCAFEKGFFKTETMRLIAMNFRHYNVTVVITVQYALDIPTDIRQGIDYCLCMRDNSMSNKQRYWKHFFGQAPEKQFYRIFDELTNNFSCIVGDNKAQSSNVTDSLFWYRADPSVIPAQFKMGRPAYWLLTQKCYIDEDAAEEQLHQQVPVFASLAAVVPSTAVPPPDVVRHSKRRLSPRSERDRPHSRSAFRHTDSSIVRRNQPTLPVHIIVT